ncbi:DUF5703 family protein [Nocardioides daphniae]|uniref:Uncharacterized protein n=1 Tax=Nocardioides daphniae TaxID=402297 RepID=A0A4P7UD56_9ACTN|nr:DUF5703 family protein [Nocardioides daphniae]QCC77285.1 hypothetical protein E2C04_08955 [Nocardioides daphniae]
MAPAQRTLGRGVEWEFDTVVYPATSAAAPCADCSSSGRRNGGWELSRLRIRPDGSRSVVLRRKIIRQRPTFLL